jgi:hypothetical protein
LNFEGFSRDFEICSRFLGFYGELFEEFLIKVYQDFVDMGMALTTDLTNRKGQIAVMATDQPRPRPSIFIYIFLIFSAFLHEKTGTR